MESPVGATDRSGSEISLGDFSVALFEALILFLNCYRGLTPGATFCRQLCWLVELLATD
jgi:hypothetical protein